MFLNWGVLFLLFPRADVARDVRTWVFVVSPHGFQINQLSEMDRSNESANGV